MFTSSFFENKTGFVPDASQPFGKEFDRYAASQNIPRGTPQYDKAMVKAASQEVQVTWFTPQGRLRRERILRQRHLDRMDNLPSEEGHSQLDAVAEDDESEAKENDDDDAESVVSIDVGLSQALMSEDYRLPFVSSKEEDVQPSNFPPISSQMKRMQQNNLPEKPEAQSSLRIDSVTGSSSPHKKLVRSSPHAEQEPADIDFDDRSLTAHNDSGNESVVSLDEGLTQKYLPDDEPKADHQAEKEELEDEEDEPPTLTYRDLLLGYQALCRETGRTPGKTIRGCQTTLKAKPYVNIIDYIDAVRMDAEIPSFDSWERFMNYTLGTQGKRINSKEAGKDEFLRWLLQKFDEGGPANRRQDGNAGNGRRQHTRNPPPGGRVPHRQPPGNPVRHARSRDARMMPY